MVISSKQACGRVILTAFCSVLLAPSALLWGIPIRSLSWPVVDIADLVPRGTLLDWGESGEKAAFSCLLIP